MVTPCSWCKQDCISRRPLDVETLPEAVRAKFSDVQHGVAAICRSCRDAKPWDEAEHAQAKDIGARIADPADRQRAKKAASAGIDPKVHSKSLIQQWLDQQLRRIRNDDDLIIVVTGDERKGKSTLAFLIACYMDPDYDPTVQCTYSGDDFSRVGSSLGKYRVVTLDEAIRGGFSRDAPTEANKKLAKFLTVCGERNLIGLICWPKLRWLDPILKEHRCKWNLHVEHRYRDHAVAVLRLLRDDERVYDPPLEIFRFPFPKAAGPRWLAQKTTKARFVTEVGRGQDVRNTVRTAVLQNIRDRIRPTVVKVLKVKG